MNRPFDVRLPLEQSYLRRGLFAIELLDAVTLFRVSQGVKVNADGLAGLPTVNAGGLFVWLNEDAAQLRSVSIDPGTLPYDRVERMRAELRLPPDDPAITTIQLSPRVSYPFVAGVTGLRATLIETRGSAPHAPVPGAGVGLRWLEDDGTTWHDPTITSRTDAAGDFAAVLRFSASDMPRVDAGGSITVRLQVERGAGPRESADLTLPQGRVTDPSTSSPLTFAWDELQP